MKIDIQENFGLNTLPYKNDARTKKIDSKLLAAMSSFEKGKNMSSDKTMHVEGNKILIQAYAKSVNEAPALLKSLTSMGMTHGKVYKHVINGMLPFEKIESTMDLASMRNISMVVTPKNNIGSVTGQADQSMKTSQLKNITGVNGSGIKIGILSDSYDDLGGASAGVLSGDLPGVGNPNGFTTPVEVLEDFGPGIDEGRAMAELIHDVAPGASLAFHTAFAGFASYAAGIIDLRQAGCDIIVDDVFYLAQPYFQEDIIGQAVNEVVADGAMYFSSAGNQANNSYDEAYVPGGFLFDFGGGNVYEPHDWGGGDYFLQVTIPPGEFIDLFLQWDEPSILAGMVGPQQDIDILVFNATLTNIIGGSFEINPSDGVPVESFFGFNGGITPITINIFVGRWSLTPGNPNRLKFIDIQGDEVGPRYEYPNLITKSTLVGHENTTGAIAVGAAPYFRTPEFGIAPPEIESFSSVGGTPILFAPDGTRLTTPILLQKPDITAPDGINNTFFGGDFEPDGFSNFFGTSAAAPNAAALAALLKDTYPTFTNARIKELMLTSAIDMDDPRGVHSNVGSSTFDFATGYGLVNSVAAYEAVPTLGEWSLIILGLMIMIYGVVAIRSRMRVKA
ncbi:MAG: S8 family serine peptidase [Saprospiraceae bacterium]